MRPSSVPNAAVRSPAKVRRQEHSKRDGNDDKQKENRMPFDEMKRDSIIINQIRANAIKLANDHKLNCTKECTISLYLLRELLRLAKIQMTQDEEAAFF